jgi:hypothetical protein
MNSSLLAIQVTPLLPHLGPSVALIIPVDPVLGGQGLSLACALPPVPNVLGFHV